MAHFPGMAVLGSLPTDPGWLRLLKSSDTVPFYAALAADLPIPQSYPGYTAATRDALGGGAPNVSLLSALTPGAPSTAPLLRAVHSACAALPGARCLLAPLPRGFQAALPRTGQPASVFALGDLVCRACGSAAPLWQPGAASSPAVVLLPAGLQSPDSQPVLLCWAGPVACLAESSLLAAADAVLRSCQVDASAASPATRAAVAACIARRALVWWLAAAHRCHTCMAATCALAPPGVVCTAQDSTPLDTCAHDLPDAGILHQASLAAALTAPGFAAQRADGPVWGRFAPLDPALYAWPCAATAQAVHPAFAWPCPLCTRKLLWAGDRAATASALLKAWASTALQDSHAVDSALDDAVRAHECRLLAGLYGAPAAWAVELFRAVARAFALTDAAPGWSRGAIPAPRDVLALTQRTR